MIELLMSELCTMRKGQTINEVDIYNLKGVDINNSIPIISSSTLNNGVMGHIDRKHMDLYKKIGRSGDLSWVTNGYAGKVTYRESDFLPTEKCGVAAIKTKYKDIVNPKWLEIYLNSITKKYVAAKEGNGKLEIVQMKNIPVIIPNLEEQDEIVNNFGNNQNIVSNLQKKLFSLNEQLKNLKTINEKSISYKLGELFSLFQGHQLTDKFIYDNIGLVPVISGSGNKIKGFINTTLIDSNNLPCIIYQTKGNKSFTSVVMNEPFNANNTAVLIPKENIKHLYNIEYIQIFLHKNMQEIVNSESGVSYIDTKILDTFIYLPLLNIQNEILKEYKRLSDIKDNLELIINKYSP
jgi:hypothetical protein